MKNIVYLEIIRIIAIFGVLFNHTNQYGFFMFPTAEDKVGYFVSMVLSVLCKMSVPLFFMISGYLLLGRTESFAQVIKKRVVRYSVVVISASTFTYVLTTIHNAGDFSLRELAKIVYRGDYGTYWFLYAYLGLMFMLPFLRGVAGVVSKTTVYYLLILKLLFTGVLPIAIFISLGYFMETAVSITILEDSLFYFIIGFYFGTAENFYESKRKRTVWLAASFACMIISCYMIYYEYRVSGSYSESFMNNFMPVFAITLFGMVRYYTEHMELSQKIERIILFIGDKTLGIYLLEPIIKVYFVGVWKYYIGSFYPLIASFLWCLTAFAAGLVITWALKLIPGVKRII
ncbi:MAG: acyltransferase family protein [Clostridiales bacterium]|nr:acyltransferase family protein [Clostridiales bacterium]